ncbi:uncharacterized protein LOC115450259 [Manduca sexta]|uniref:Uncharacterized protein n=1 Tax=Manduca sexta TaxID=7130 RepID=A0A921ZM60_MANSE|nr:uncharacterized protein LOC115450259 [Manduca sexta]KAG6460542.1 hypothetical protein O3G_MSEX012049 [Manduca sexta]KAG6460543.1 hypothetical protein O3G_MSEX012049 [Manduca sexta]
MYRLALLLVLSCVLLVQADDEWMDFMQKCGQLIHPAGIRCCKKKYVSTDLTEDLKECMQLPGKPPSCEIEICVAKKRGFASDDGTINKAAFKALLSKMDDKDLQASIVEDCVDGDISEYGPDDLCDLKRLHTCVALHLVVDCPEWSNEGACSGSADVAADCIKSMQ